MRRIGLHVGDLRLTNCTVAANSALNGNALACDSNWQAYPSNVQFTNCILWDDGDEIWNNDNSTITMTHSDIWGNWPGHGNIDADPCFVDEANEDYHLLPVSPCIDAGDPNHPYDPSETDLDGRPRVIGGRIDMGAYEYSQPIPAEAIIVPCTINLASKGNWITCYIWLPKDYDVADIDPNSIFLEDEIPSVFVRIDEHNQFVTVRFTREEVQSILDIGEVELKITGRLTNGTVFEATDTIKVIDKIDRKSHN